MKHDRSLADKVLNYYIAIVDSISSLVYQIFGAGDIFDLLNANYLFQNY